MTFVSVMAVVAGGSRFFPLCAVCQGFALLAGCCLNVVSSIRWTDLLRHRQLAHVHQVQVQVFVIQVITRVNRK